MDWQTDKVNHKYVYFSHKKIEEEKKDRNGNYWG